MLWFRESLFQYYPSLDFKIKYAAAAAGYCKEDPLKMNQETAELSLKKKTFFDRPLFPFLVFILPSTMIFQFDHQHTISLCFYLLDLFPSKCASV